MTRDDLERHISSHASDISGHLLHFYDECVKSDLKCVLEIGVRGGESTQAILSAMEVTGGQLTSVDVERPNLPPHPNWRFILGDSREVDVTGPFDAILIDSGHTFDLTLAELRRFAPMTRLVWLHDVIPAKPEIKVKEAIEAFMAENAEWEYAQFDHSNGLGVLSR